MKRRPSSNRGMALLTALIVMVMLAAVVAILYRVGSLDMNKTMNSREVANARLASESGLSYIKYHIRECEMSSCDSGNDAIAGLKQYFTGIGIGYTGTTTSITIPDTSIAGMDGTFSATITSLGSGEPDEDTDPVLNLLVTGKCNGTQRSVKIDFRLALGSRSPLFDFGFSSGGTLRMQGDCWLRGLNDSDEANIYMSSLTDSTTVTISGTSMIEGNVFACHDAATVDYNGSSCSVGGETGADIANSVYQGVDKYPMPQIDTTPFVNAVGTLTTINTPTCDAGTYTNIRIAAGTNPSFTADTVITGVIYVESPNIVTFKNATTITGVIITEPGTGTVSSSIDFKSNVEMKSVDYLPDTSQWAALKALPGTSILAEGFSVIFRGDSQIIGGTMAADSFSFRGNRETTVKGSIICYGDSDVDTELKGVQHFWIDMSDCPETPPGFVGGGLTVLVPLADTYASTPEGHF